ncbi:MAG: 4-(cytidine 5'-diphospho)-2-C-methyl-D-erythritol kinase [Candidatus Omnitrophica bacterium]|nr:4-(cytidine 5'-diphospho)-2-C-methyl-D-erythritol kinase [Candidatus Omnitrophota bacterium]MDD5310865.1 4-(cytidine 5'-diphospho)-2-C-methyl-D-erythritol kinase [Candidatus Omnitrophota bacterium]MDD5546361.1 4-(cytidine 5'-diphospho)-2-C-methyl-D-erythritol kinase [Candidatus Omnitrophota bacterium]
MPVINLRPPAKINLCLKVLRKRPDGYHDIETVFERIDLCDELTLKPIPEDIVVKCDDPQVPCDKRNLIYKAAQMLREKCGVLAGVEMTLKKNIPVAAGLGGASSDCAYALRGLNELWNLKLNKSQLFEISGAIGADVAFFLLDSGRAIGRGRGEILEPCGAGQEKDGFWYLLVNPGFPVLAKEAYEALNLGLTSAPSDSRINPVRLKEIRFEGLKDLLFNSLEVPVERKFSAISEMKSAIKEAGLRFSIMSGSGPTVYGVASGKEEALEAKSRLILRKGWQAFVAQTLW